MPALKVCILCAGKTHGGGYLENVPLCRKHTDVLMVRHIMKRCGLTLIDMADAEKLAAGKRKEDEVTVKMVLHHGYTEGCCPGCPCKASKKARRKAQ